MLSHPKYINQTCTKTQNKKNEENEINFDWHFHFHTTLFGLCVHWIEHDFCLMARRMNKAFVKNIPSVCNQAIDPFSISQTATSQNEVCIITSYFIILYMRSSCWNKLLVCLKWVNLWMYINMDLVFHMIEPSWFSSAIFIKYFWSIRGKIIHILLLAMFFWLLLGQLYALSLFHHLSSLFLYMLFP